MYIWLYIYIDNILLIRKSPDQMEDHLKVLLLISIDRSRATDQHTQVNHSFISTNQAPGLLVDLTILHLRMLEENLHCIRLKIYQVSQRSTYVCNCKTTGSNSKETKCCITSRPHCSLVSSIPPVYCSPTLK